MTGPRPVRSTAAVAATLLIAGALAPASEATRATTSRPGRLVVVTNTQELAVVKPDGTGMRKLTRRLPGINSPRWSPNGARIAFARDRRYEWSPKAPLYVVRADGSHMRRVGFGHSPRWSPDGRRLMFVDVHGLYEAPAGDSPPATGRIVVVDVASGRRHVIGRGEAPAWSPDGKRVAFVRYDLTKDHSWYPIASRLLTMKADGSAVRVLKAPDSASPYILFDPKWSPDGRTIAVWTENICDQCEPAADAGYIQLIDAETGKTRRLLKPDGPFEWSPDGKLLALTGFRTGGQTVDVETGAVTVLVRGGIGAGWSPNGGQIGFVRCIGENSDRCYVYAVNADGSRFRRLVQTSSYTPVDRWTGEPVGSFDWGR
jgi:dipeptidyl aminopeptidase/acylaminoacyl peptidase